MPLLRSSPGKELGLSLKARGKAQKNAEGLLGNEPELMKARIG
jgi:hypothetical protein